MNDLHFRMLNINSNTNALGVIQESLKEIVNDELDHDGMCIVYALMLHENLDNQGVLNRIIKTKDYGLSYEHEAILAYTGKEYILIDPTYEQFIKKDNRALYGHFKEFPGEVLKRNNPKLHNNLSKDKYSEIDDKDLLDYFKAIDQENLVQEIKISDIIRKVQTKK